MRLIGEIALVLFCIGISLAGAIGLGYVGVFLCKFFTICK